MGRPVNAPYCVTLPGLGAVACRAGIADGVSWRLYSDAWRCVGNILTWDTEDGAQLFADMNGGTVKPLSEVFDHTVILPPHGPLQHSPDEARPLEGSTRQK